MEAKGVVKYPGARRTVSLVILDGACAGARFKEASTTKVTDLGSPGVFGVLPRGVELLKSDETEEDNSAKDSYARHGPEGLPVHNAEAGSSTRIVSCVAV